MMAWLHEHGWWMIPAIVWLFSNLVSTMPELPANAGWFATWAYRLAHVLAGNAKNLVQSFQKLNAKGN